MRHGKTHEKEITVSEQWFDTHSTVEVRCPGCKTQNTAIVSGYTIIQCTQCSDSIEITINIAE